MSEGELFQRWLREHVSPRLHAIHAWQVAEASGGLQDAFLSPVVTAGIAPFVYWKNAQVQQAEEAAIKADLSRSPQSSGAASLTAPGASSSPRTAGNLSPDPTKPSVDLDALLGEVESTFDGKVEVIDEPDGTHKVAISSFLEAEDFRRLGRMLRGFKYDSAHRMFVPEKQLYVPRSGGGK